VASSYRCQIADRPPLPKASLGTLSPEAAGRGGSPAIGISSSGNFRFRPQRLVSLQIGLAGRNRISDREQKKAPLEAAL